MFNQWFNDQERPDHFKRLKSIVTDGAIFMENTFQKDIVITSIYRADDSPYHLHDYWRAIDTRTKTPEIDKPEDNWTPEMIEKYCNYINEKYPYDINRPKLKTVIYEVAGQMGSNAPHLHHQIMA